MDSFELEHAQEILKAHFRWANSSSSNQGHCSSIEWRYDNGSYDACQGTPSKYNLEAVMLAGRIFGLMSIDLNKWHKVIKLHYTTRLDTQKMARATGIHYKRYDLEFDRATLAFYNRLKKECGSDRFSKLFLV